MTLHIHHQLLVQTHHHQIYGLGASLDLTCLSAGEVSVKVKSHFFKAVLIVTGFVTDLKQDIWFCGKPYLGNPI